MRLKVVLSAFGNNEEEEDSFINIAAETLQRLRFKMAKIEYLNSFFIERLMAVAGDIFEAVKDTVAEYQEEIERTEQENRRLKRILTEVNIKLNNFSPSSEKITAASPDLPLTSCTDEQNSSQDPLDSESSPGHLTTMWQGEGDEPQSALNSASTSISPGKKSVCGNQTIHADPQEPPHFSQDPLDPKPSFIQVKVELSTMNQEAELQEPLPDSSASPSPSGRESPCLLSGNTIKGEKTDNDLHNTGATIKVEPQDIDCENTPPPGIQREDGQDLRDDEGNSYFRSKMPLDHVSPAETRPQKQTEVFFRCKYCGKFVASRGRLKQHLVVHQKSRPRPYRCDLCGKSYSYAYVLENHHRTHTGERPYHCRFCGKCFKQKGHLSSHEKIHTGERPYGCLICGKRFIQSCQVKRHVRNHHQDKKQFL